MIAATTTLQETLGEIQKAKEISRQIQIPFISRKGQSIDRLCQSHGILGILVVSTEKITYRYPGGEFFFHPGMAKLRINEILNGKTDQMIKAMDLSPGDTILDCTLGLGSDAIVASSVSCGGKVTGIECSPVLSLIVKEGLANYSKGSDEGLIRAMRRIQVVCSDHNHFLRMQPDDSADIIYFDPMFRVPGRKSSAMEVMRPLTNASPLTPETIKEALRVARRRVVVKESRNSLEFSRLGIDKISGGKYSPVSYGIIEKGRWLY